MCLSVPAQIISLSSEDPVLRTGKVSFGGVLKEVNFSYIPEAKVGDYVLVHVGFAITLIDEEAAKKVFESLQELTELVEAEDRKILEKSL